MQGRDMEKKNKDVNKLLRKIERANNFDNEAKLQGKKDKQELKINSISNNSRSTRRRTRRKQAQTTIPQANAIYKATSTAGTYVQTFHDPRT